MCLFEQTNMRNEKRESQKTCAVLCKIRGRHSFVVFLLNYDIYAKCHVCSCWWHCSVAACNKKILWSASFSAQVRANYVISCLVSCAPSLIRASMLFSPHLAHNVTHVYCSVRNDVVPILLTHLWLWLDLMQNRCSSLWSQMGIPSFIQITLPHTRLCDTVSVSQCDVIKLPAARVIRFRPRP